MMGVNEVADLVKDHLSGEGSGHDWEHIRRVWNNALKLAEIEGADVRRVSLAALLHDVDDAKLTGDVTTEQTHPLARAMMQQAEIDKTEIEVICEIIGSMGYRKSLGGVRPERLEGQILSDADFLDALGAIGIARTFAYGGHKKRALFLPEQLPVENLSQNDYVTAASPSLNHFFEKLLRLQSMMFTAAGKAEAAKRHARMVQYLDAFFEEAAAPDEWRTLLAAYR